MKVFDLSKENLRKTIGEISEEISEKCIDISYYQKDFDMTLRFAIPGDATDDQFFSYLEKTILPDTVELYSLYQDADILFVEADTATIISWLYGDDVPDENVVKTITLMIGSFQMMALYNLSSLTPRGTFNFKGHPQESAEFLINSIINHVGVSGDKIDNLITAHLYLFAENYKFDVGNYSEYPHDSEYYDDIMYQIGSIIVAISTWIERVSLILESKNQDMLEKYILDTKAEKSTAVMYYTLSLAIPKMNELVDMYMYKLHEICGTYMVNFKKMVYLPSEYDLSVLSDNMCLINLIDDGIDLANMTIEKYKLICRETVPQLLNNSIYIDIPSDDEYPTARKELTSKLNNLFILIENESHIKTKHVFAEIFKSGEESTAFIERSNVFASLLNIIKNSLSRLGNDISEYETRIQKIMLTNLHEEN